MVNDERLSAALLHDLYDVVEWNAQSKRTYTKTEKMLHSSCYVAAWSEGRLVGFGRILADPYTAQILDVMTHPGYWKTGIASGVMTRLLDYARGRFLNVTLVAPGGLEGFYARFGFDVANPRSDALMILTDAQQAAGDAGTQETEVDESWYERPRDERGDEVSERLAAGGVVVRAEGERLKVALVREAGLGRVILPKGGVEAGEGVLAAAEREIAEEAGITDLRMVLKLGVKERLSYDKKRWTVTHYFLFSAEQVEGTPSDDAHDYRLEWHDLASLPPMFWPEQRALIETNRETIRMFLAP